MNKETYEKKLDEWSCLSTRVEDHDLLCECDTCAEFLRMGDELAIIKLNDEKAKKNQMEKTPNA